MKKILFIAAAMIGLISASCSQDEPATVLPGAKKQINYTVSAGNGSRATSAYENGTDVDKITVSAWAIAPKEDGSYGTLPGYGSPNTGNAAYFTNDVLTRSGIGSNEKSGTFNYEEDARYWPNNGEQLDFWALVDHDAFGSFSFSVDGKPGIDATIEQGGLEDMPDMLYATAFDQLAGHKQAQQNVSFHFDHAFAQVVVTAQVKNKNLHVVITDLEIHGIRKAGKFYLPYKSGQGEEIVKNPASWVVPDEYGNVAGLFTKDEVVLANKGDKATLLGDGTKENMMLVLPGSYNGRNGSSCQTYIQLKGYAYNKSGDTLDEDCDILIYGSGTGKSPVPMIMRIPIEFNWVMGTINTYNIIFDCGNGGETPGPGEDPNNPDPNKPAFMRIGYEVEVNDWVTGENKPDYEYPDHLKTNEQ